MARYGFKQLKPMKDATYHGVKKKWKLRRTRHINDYGGKHESYAMAGNNCGVASETHGTFPQKTTTQSPSRSINRFSKTRKVLTSSVK